MDTLEKIFFTSLGMLVALAFIGCIFCLAAWMDKAFDDPDCEDDEDDDLDLDDEGW